MPDESNDSVARASRAAPLPDDVYQRLDAFRKRTHRTWGGAVAALLDNIAEPLPKPSSPSPAENPA